jgi:hypothetical protein
VVGVPLDLSTRTTPLTQTPAARGALLELLRDDPRRSRCPAIGRAGAGLAGEQARGETATSGRGCEEEAAGGPVEDCQELALPA